MRGARFTLRTDTDGWRLVLLEGYESLWWDAVVRGRVVSLDFLVFFCPLDDDVARVATNVDHVAEVAVRVVVVVARCSY